MLKEAGAPPPVILTEEDKAKFKKEAKKLNPVELLAVADFVNTCGRFTAKDLRFMNSCIGQRCERLLRNVVNKFTWND